MKTELTLTAIETVAAKIPTFKEWVENRIEISELCNRILEDLQSLEDLTAYTSKEVSNIIDFLQENIKEQ